MENLTLIKSLTEQTQELKELYLTETESYARKEFPRMEASYNAPMEKWYAKYDVETIMQKSHRGLILRDDQYDRLSDDEKKEVKIYLTNHSKEYNRRNLYKMRNARDRLYKEIELGVDFYVAKKIKDAHAHYEHSIAKLAFRIEQKGLKDNVALKSSRIERNFETIATDGIKIVRAFTILAWGEVNAPHYRYLIK